MGKAIIICCDGTWNRPETEAGASSPTNVLRVVRSIVPEGPQGSQVVYYDQGVGTGGVWDKWVGGALGVGLSQNIMEAYRFLANNWAEGDRIYLFGFSRGAYTVRSLAGLIHVAGLLPKHRMPLFPQLYRHYRLDPAKRAASQDAALVQRLRDEVTAVGRQPKIDFLGVWDTVGALGLPITGLRGLSQHWVGFHDTQLSETVQYAVQALAIDELRRPFAADLWTHAPDSASDRLVKDEQRVLQVWFAGSHSDIGGGYAETELADLALEFLIDQATAHGLHFDTSGLVLTPPLGRCEGPLHNEYKVLYALQDAWHRPIGPIQRKALGLELGINERIHFSAIKRMNSAAEMLNAFNLREAVGQGVPVYFPRRHVRLSVVGAETALALLDESPVCELLDYSAGGARLRCLTPRVVGSEAELSHPAFGKRKARVQWAREGEIGVQFAA